MSTTPLAPRRPRPVALWAALAAGLAASAATALAAAGVVAPVAAAVAVALAVGGGAAVARLYLRHGGAPERFAPCNRVTLARGGLLCLLAALALAPGALALPAVAWGALALALLALALDGVDGWLARRTGTASAFGARFDMEVDAALVLVLALMVWTAGKAGPWVLALGLMRYAFVAAGWRWRWLAAPLPPSGRRRAVCGVQIAVLAALLAPVLGPPLSAVAAAATLALLAWSFAVDVRWLWRARGRARGRARA